MWHYSSFLSPAELATKFERIILSHKRHFLRSRLQDASYVTQSARLCRDYREVYPLFRVKPEVAELYLPWFVAYNRQRMCRWFAYQ